MTNYMAFGELVFEFIKSPIDSISDSSKFRWRRDNILDGSTNSQFTGVGEKQRTIAGAFYPDLGGVEVFEFKDEIERIGSDGEVRNLLDSDGKNLGRYYLTDFKVTESDHDPFGQPIMIKFTATFFRYDNENI